MITDPGHVGSEFFSEHGRDVTAGGDHGGVQPLVRDHLHLLQKRFLIESNYGSLSKPDNGSQNKPNHGSKINLITEPITDPMIQTNYRAPSSDRDVMAGGDHGGVQPLVRDHLHLLFSFITLQPRVE